jgi:hypothetical protein
MVSAVVGIPLVLRFSKAVTKEAMQMAPCFGRPSPDPRLCSMVELCRGHLHGALDLISIGKTLAGKRITTEEPPPAFLEVEPTSTLGNEDVLNAALIASLSLSAYPGRECKNRAELGRESFLCDMIWGDGRYR